MKLRFIQWLALAALVLVTPSCGIAEMLGRTASNTIQKTGKFASAAANAAY